MPYNRIKIFVEQKSLDKAFCEKNVLFDRVVQTCLIAFCEKKNHILAFWEKNCDSILWTNAFI